MLARTKTYKTVRVHIPSAGGGGGTLCRFAAPASVMVNKLLYAWHDASWRWVLTGDGVPFTGWRRQQRTAPGARTGVKMPQHAFYLMRVCGVYVPATPWRDQQRILPRAGNRNGWRPRGRLTGSRTDGVRAVDRDDPGRMVHGGDLADPQVLLPRLDRAQIVRDVPGSKWKSPPDKERLEGRIGILVDERNVRTFAFLRLRAAEFRRAASDDDDAGTSARSDSLSARGVCCDICTGIFK